MSAPPRLNYITPAGFAALRAEYDHLLGEERPRIVEIVSWAAGNGDRSENGDYLYGRKRMREIDRRLKWLSERMKAAKVVNPADQPDKSRVFFGATVTIADEEDNQRVVTITGNYEADAGAGRNRLDRPLSRALPRRGIRHPRRVTLPGGEKEWEITAIAYPA